MPDSVPTTAIPSTPTERVSWRVAALAIAIVVLATAGLVELAARLFGPAWLRPIMDEHNAGRRAEVATDLEWPVVEENGHFRSFRPGAHFTQSYIEWTTPVNIDGLGGRRVRTSNGSGSPIAWMGDSFTFGAGVSDEETFVSAVCSSVGAVCANFGLPGSCLPDQMDIFELRRTELSQFTDVVFVIFLGNDLDDMMSRAVHHVASDDAPNAHAPRALSRLNDLAQPLFRFSWAAQLTKSVAMGMINRASHMNLEDPSVLAIKNDPVYVARMGEVLEANLAHMKALSAKLHFRPAFVLVPDRLQISRALRENRAAYYGLHPAQFDARIPNRIVASQLARHGFPYVDVTDALEGHSELYYVKDNHLRPAGHARVAAEVVRNWKTLFPDRHLE